VPDAQSAGTFVGLMSGCIKIRAAILATPMRFAIRELVLSTPIAKLDGSGLALTVHGG